MTQISIKVIVNELFSKPVKKHYATNETDVSHTDDIWSLDNLELKDYGPENNRGYRFVLVIIDNFSEFGCTSPLKNKNSQTKTDSFENVLISSRRKPNLIESDHGKECYKSIFKTS